MTSQSQRSPASIRGSESEEHGGRLGPSYEKHQKSKGVRTREKILGAAGQRFARSGYSGVTLRDIADDAGITPAMIVRYFGSKRALFDEVAHVHNPQPPLGPEASIEARARRLIDFWQDPFIRNPAISLLRSLELDGGELFRAKLANRFVEPASEAIHGPDVDVRLNLAVGLLLGIGFFSFDTLFNPDQPPMSKEETERFVPYVTRLLDVCFKPPPEVPGQSVAATAPADCAVALHSASTTRDAARR